MLLLLQFITITSDEFYSSKKNISALIYEGDKVDLAPIEEQLQQLNIEVYKADCLVEERLCVTNIRDKQKFPAIIKKEGDNTKIYDIDQFILLEQGKAIVLQINKNFTGDHFEYYSNNCDGDDKNFQKFDIKINDLKIACFHVEDKARTFYAVYGNERIQFNGTFTIGQVKHFVLKYSRGLMDYVPFYSADEFVFYHKNAGIVVERDSDMKTFLGLDYNNLYGYFFEFDPAVNRGIPCSPVPCAFAQITAENGEEEEWFYPLFSLEQFPEFMEKVMKHDIKMSNWAQVDQTAKYQSLYEFKVKENQVKHSVFLGVLFGLGALFVSICSFVVTILYF